MKQYMIDIPKHNHLYIPTLDRFYSYGCFMDLPLFYISSLRWHTFIKNDILLNILNECNQQES